MKEDEKVTEGQEMLERLAGFTGTMDWYKHVFTQQLIYTDGIRFLAKQYEAYWLIDFVALTILPHLLKQLNDWFFAINIAVNEQRECLITVDDGGTDPENRRCLFKERIDWTSLPVVENMKMFLTWANEKNGQPVYCLMVPSEY